jgi:putative resolvase
MKLSEWARKNDISYKTAWRWFHEGKLPVPARQVGEGKTIIVFEERPRPSEDDSVVIYCRVSGHDQKDDLERQAERLKNFASASGLKVKSVITEIGSGLNGKRPKLLKLFADPNIGSILVEHKDRLTRFGFEYIETLLEAQGRRVIVADDTELELDIWQDFIDVVTSFCARIYGKRGARNRAKKTLEMLRDQEKPNRD